MRTVVDKIAATEQVAETGRLLLEQRLVARTWGNFSARLDETHFCITPSGLGYEHMTAADIVCCDLTDGSYTGERCPSSELGIHRAAYRLFPETGFVIHTHQTYATALGLTGTEHWEITREERERLGGVARADYGLPGTEKLHQAVTAAMETGAQTVLMVHHGALLCGHDRADAMARAALLEEICRRSCRGQESPPALWSEAETAQLRERLRITCPTADVVSTDAARAWSLLRRPLIAQLDDMAQMVGWIIPVAKNAPNAQVMLRSRSAVLLPGAGILVQGSDAEDTEALKQLTHKAAVAALHCRAWGEKARLPLKDCLYLRRFYLKKYAERKRG